jgi:hypothetical protein
MWPKIFLLRATDHGFDICVAHEMSRIDDALERHSFRSS